MRSRFSPPVVRSLVCASLLVFALVARADEYAEMLLGNPSKANESDANNYLMKEKYFALSYDELKGEPNWVSWRLTKDDLGEAPRKKSFFPDPALPHEMHPIPTKAYTNSGFDRGHMCPHGDRTKDQDMSYATFVTTNIIPQAPNVNREAWDQIEIYCRELAKSGNRLYIIDGPEGQGGTGTYGYADTIDDGKVVVPSYCWKIVVIVPDLGKDDLHEITAKTRVLAIKMPNDNAVGYEWEKYRTTVSQIEKDTGYHFFNALPPDVAKALEEEVDTTPLPPPVPVFHGRPLHSGTDTEQPESQTM